MQSLLDDMTLNVIIIETVDAEILMHITNAGFAEYFFDPFKRLISGTPANPSANNALYIRKLDLAQKRVASAPPLDVLGIPI